MQFISFSNRVFFERTGKTKTTLCHVLYQQKIDGSAKIRCVSKNLLSYQNAWWWLSKR